MVLQQLHSASLLLERRQRDRQSPDRLEAKAQPSGLTVYGVAPYKITNEEALAEMAYLQAQFGYAVRYNSPITSRAELAELEANYDAIFLGIGLGKTSSLAR